MEEGKKFRLMNEAQKKAVKFVRDIQERIIAAGYGDEEITKILKELTFGALTPADAIEKAEEIRDFAFSNNPESRVS